MKSWLLIGLAALALGCGSDSDDTSGTSSTSSGCPPSCFAPSMCVTACGEPATDYGCCPCPAGTINELSCPAACGLVGSPCPGATDCGNGLSCTATVCAPSGAMCAPPPGGVGCDANTDCLLVSGTADGICVTADEQACLCDSAGSFDCP